MKINKYLAIAVVLIVLGSACIVSAKPTTPKNNSKGEEKRIDALMKVKARIIEIKGYDPSQWPAGLVELFLSYGLIR